MGYSTSVGIYLYLFEERRHQIMDIINNIVNTIIEYLNMALEMIDLKVTGTFDAQKIIDAIMELIGGFDLGGLFGG